MQLPNAFDVIWNLQAGKSYVARYFQEVRYGYLPPNQGLLLNDQYFHNPHRLGSKNTWSALTSEGFRALS